MIRFNTQIAEIAADYDLCRKICECYTMGQSVRHIATKFQISDYAVRKIAKYYANAIDN